MTVAEKFQIKIRFSIELHGNSKLSMTSCPPSSDLRNDLCVKWRALPYMHLSILYMTLSIVSSVTIESNKRNKSETHCFIITKLIEAFSFVEFRVEMIP